MTAERNREGFYTAEALRSGFIDQHAVMSSIGMVRIELCHGGAGRLPWRVSHSIHRGESASITDRAFESLDEARREFRRLVRKYG